METLNITRALVLVRKLCLKFDIMSTSFFLSRRTILPSKKGGMPCWQDRLFIALAQNASNATDYFGLPSGRVVELGLQTTDHLAAPSAGLPTCARNFNLSVFDLISLLLALTAGFAWVNHRYLKLPPSTGILVMGLAASSLLVLLELAVSSVALYADVAELVRQIDSRRR
jgi:hypothetical protein